MSRWTSDSVRETFLRYFKEQGHEIVPSSPLLPAEDKTLLFTNAGMNQFKDLFLGKEKRSYTRAATAQKCVRAGGKHNDLEQGGFTARHHTFFEMLGNFSFGDYFKKEAIHYAWELVTSPRWFAIPKERLYITIYKDDDEAFEIWNKQEKVPPERIFRLGEKDNFWAMGDTGPCGPCSEIHYDLWSDLSSREHFRGNEPDWDSGRFVEIWNLVFMQYERDEKGALTPLPKPSIDTGMGLERTTAALNGLTANYDIDIFRSLINFLKELRGGSTDPRLETSFRVIADHARATAFLIADTITPSNEGRGYVLRRIMRRAIRHGHKMGFRELFFLRACEKLIELMGHHYRELYAQREMIVTIAAEEERRFRQTLEKGLELLADGIAAVRAGGAKVLPGDLVFRLYDTYGFPPDLTRTILDEEGLTYDEAGYEAAMREQQERGKASWVGDSAAGRSRAAKELREKGVPENRFVGYEYERHEGKIVALFDESLSAVNTLPANASGFALLDPTPFYAESGGQVGDHGVLKKEGKTVAKVTDCVKGDEYRLAVIETTAPLTVGEKVTQEVDHERRSAIRRNHSATHLLHLALKKRLGAHANQSGSLVTPERLRFDFTHFKALTADEIRDIETEVNRRILANQPVSTEETSIDAAKKSGATALFGEKYGEKVRVVAMDESKELCGGTHAARTGDIGLFKIVKEEGIAAGVRRIEAVTGLGALAFVQENESLLTQAAAALGAERASLVTAIEKQREERKALQKKLEELETKIAAIEAKEMKPTLVSEGIPIYILDAGKRRAEVIQLSDSLKASVPDGLFILVGRESDAAVVVVSASGKAKERYDCGRLLKELVTPFGGRGGGKRDMAQGGAPEIDFGRFLEAVKTLIGTR